MSRRLDYQSIAQWISPDARVLDLGCETGDLLCYLRDKKNSRGIGIDIDNNNLTHCLSRGLQVIYTDIRRDLSLFADGSFDYVVLSQTLQNIDRPPQHLLEEMLRVGRAAIVSFPNFAYYPLRWQLFFSGRMPRGFTLPHSWHDTPNVRYCTITDFEDWCAEAKFTVHEKIFLGPDGRVATLANLRAQTAIYYLTAQADTGGGQG